MDGMAAVVVAGAPAVEVGPGLGPAGGPSGGSFSAELEAAQQARLSEAGPGGNGAEADAEGPAVETPAPDGETFPTSRWLEAARWSGAETLAALLLPEVHPAAPDAGAAAGEGSRTTLVAVPHAASGDAGAWAWVLAGQPVPAADGMTPAAAGPAGTAGPVRPGSSAEGSAPGGSVRAAAPEPAGVPPGLPGLGARPAGSQPGGTGGGSAGASGANPGPAPAFPGAFPGSGEGSASGGPSPHPVAEPGSQGSPGTAPLPPVGAGTEPLQASDGGAAGAPGDSGLAGAGKARPEAGGALEAAFAEREAVPREPDRRPERQADGGLRGSASANPAARSHGELPAGPDSSIRAPGSGMESQAQPRPTAAGEAASRAAGLVPRWLEATSGAVRLEVLEARMDGPAPQMRLRLHPPELGELRLRLASDGSQVVVSVLADRPQTGLLLERHLATLEQALEQAGLRLAGFSVEVGAGSSGWRGPADQPAVFAGAVSLAPAPDQAGQAGDGVGSASRWPQGAAPARRAYLQPGAVDLRV